MAQDLELTLTVNDDGSIVIKNFAELASQSFEKVRKAANGTNEGVKDIEKNTERAAHVIYAMTSSGYHGFTRFEKSVIVVNQGLTVTRRTLDIIFDSLRFGINLVDKFTSSLVGLGIESVKRAENLANFSTVLAAQFGKTLGTEISEFAKELAIVSPLIESDVRQIVQSVSVIPTLKNRFKALPLEETKKEMKDLVETIQALSLFRPDQGTGGAIFAVRELLAGNTRSFATRFDIDFGALISRLDSSMDRFSSSAEERIKVLKNLGQFILPSQAQDELAMAPSRALANTIEVIESMFAKIGNLGDQNGLYHTVKRALNQAFDDVFEAVKDKDGPFQEGAERLGAVFTEIFSHTLSSSNETFNSIFENIFRRFGIGAGDTLIDNIGIGFIQFIEFLEKSIFDIEDFIDRLLDVVDDFFHDLDFQTIYQTIADLADTIVATFRRILDLAIDLVPAITKIAEFVAEKPGQAVGAGLAGAGLALTLGNLATDTASGLIRSTFKGAGQLMKFGVSEVGAVGQLGGMSVTSTLQAILAGGVGTVASIVVAVLSIGSVAYFANRWIKNLLETKDKKQMDQSYEDITEALNRIMLSGRNVTPADIRNEEFQKERLSVLSDIEVVRDFIKALPAQIPRDNETLQSLLKRIEIDKVGQVDTGLRWDRANAKGEIENTEFRLARENADKFKLSFENLLNYFAGLEFSDMDMVATELEFRFNDLYEVFTISGKAIESFKHQQEIDRLNRGLRERVAFLNARDTTRLTLPVEVSNNLYDRMGFTGLSESDFANDRGARQKFNLMMSSYEDNIKTVLEDLEDGIVESFQYEVTIPEDQIQKIKKSAELNAKAIRDFGIKKLAESYFKELASNKSDIEVDTIEETFGEQLSLIGSLGQESFITRDQLERFKELAKQKNLQGTPGLLAAVEFDQARISFLREYITLQLKQVSELVDNGERGANLEKIMDDISEAKKKMGSLQTQELAENTRAIQEAFLQTGEIFTSYFEGLQSIVEAQSFGQIDDIVEDISTGLDTLLFQFDGFDELKQKFNQALERAKQIGRDNVQANFDENFFRRTRETSLDKEILFSQNRVSRQSDALEVAKQGAQDVSDLLSSIESRFGPLDDQIKKKYEEILSANRKNVNYVEDRLTLEKENLKILERQKELLDRPWESIAVGAKDGLAQLESENLWRDFGREGMITLRDGLSDTLVEGIMNGTESAKEVFNNFLDDLHMMLLQTATKMLMNQLITSVFGSLLGGSGEGFGLFGFLGGTPSGGDAAGGIKQGVTPLQNFSSGAIIDRSTPSMVGEGTNPEAIVPLPHGRKIPVEVLNGDLRNNNSNPPSPPRDLTIVNSVDPEYIRNIVAEGDGELVFNIIGSQPDKLRMILGV